MGHTVFNQCNQSAISEMNVHMMATLFAVPVHKMTVRHSHQSAVPKVSLTWHHLALLAVPRPVCDYDTFRCQPRGLVGQIRGCTINRHEAQRADRVVECGTQRPQGPYA